jgi:hypothetical protein
MLELLAQLLCIVAVESVNPVFNNGFLPHIRISR